MTTNQVHTSESRDWQLLPGREHVHKPGSHFWSRGWPPPSGSQFYIRDWRSVSGRECDHKPDKYFWIKRLTNTIWQRTWPQTRFTPLNQEADKYYLVENMTTNQVHTSESQDDLHYLVHNSKSETDDQYPAENMIPNLVHTSESDLWSLPSRHYDHKPGSHF